MISPVANALFSSTLYPQPVNGNLQQNAVNTSASAFNVQQGDLKIDFKATQKDNISYRFTRAYQNNPATNSQVLLSDSYSTTPIYNTVGDWTRTLSSNLVNDARVGWSHITLNSGNSWDSSVGQFGNTLGIGNGNPAGLDGLLALNFTNSAVTNLGTQESTQSFDDHVWQVEDALSWNHGRHNFKFGGQWWGQTIKTFYAGNNGQLGLMDFDGRFTASSTQASGTGDGGADFVLGLPFQYGRGVSTGKTWQQSSNVIGIYAQDTWRVTDRLTLNLGLRYDAHTPWVESNNAQANYNFLPVMSISPAKTVPAGRSTMVSTAAEISSRASVSHGLRNAWRSYRDPRGVHHLLVYGRHRHKPSFAIESTFHSGRDQCHLQQFSSPADRYHRRNCRTASAASCDAPTYACYAQAFLRVWDPNVQPAIADQWNLTVQHQFGNNTTVQIGYVGQRGTHLMVPFDFAQRELLPNSACATPPCTAPSPYFAANPTLYNVLGNPAQGGEEPLSPAPSRTAT